MTNWQRFKAAKARRPKGQPRAKAHVDHYCRILLTFVDLLNRWISRSQPKKWWEMNPTQGVLAHHFPTSLSVIFCLRIVEKSWPIMTTTGRLRSELRAQQDRSRRAERVAWQEWSAWVDRCGQSSMAMDIHGWLWFNTVEFISISYSHQRRSIRLSGNIRETGQWRWNFQDMEVQDWKQNGSQKHGIFRVLRYVAVLQANFRQTCFWWN